MRKIFTFLFFVTSYTCFSQTQQNINKSNGTVSNPINQIDSIRFNISTNQMEVILQNGTIESHNMVDIVNITLNSPSNTGCNGGINSVTDLDNNEYSVIQIGSQCWTQENLKTTKFSDGSVIANVTDNTSWIQLSSPAWCTYENSANNDIIYGKLYNWYTITDSRNVCPAGWHVPTENEWIELSNYLGGDNVSGGKMKTISGWTSPNTGATNECGFSALPGGSRAGSTGLFSEIGNSGSWWSSTESSVSTAWRRKLSNNLVDIFWYSSSKLNGFSVRCLKD